MYEINKIYKEFITNREAILANLSQESLNLKFLWKNPDENIVNTMKNVPFFQLFFKNDIMFLLIKFKGLKWIDVPLLFTKNKRDLFCAEYDEFPIEIMLINSNTGKLFLIENYKLPKGITKAFIQGIHTQKDMTKKLAIQKINAIRSSYSADEMSVLSLGNTK